MISKCVWAIYIIFIDFPSFAKNKGDKTNMDTNKWSTMFLDILERWRFFKPENNTVNKCNNFFIFYL